MFKFDKNKGFTLIETFLVIAIMMLVTGSIFVAFEKRKFYTNLDVTVKQIYQLDNGIQKVFGTVGDFTQLTLANVKSANIPNPNEIDTAGNVVTIWGNPITFAAVAFCAESGYEIVISGLTQEQCIAIGSSSVNANFMELVIKTTTVKPYTTPNIDIEMAAVVSACDSNNATIKFRNLPKRVNFADQMSRK